MKKLAFWLFTLLACLACTYEQQELDVSMAKEKIAKGDAGALPNLPGQWHWYEYSDYWAATSGSCRVFFSPDRTTMRIRGALGNAAAAQLWSAVSGFLEANGVSPTGYDLETFKTIVRADVIAEVGRHADFQEVGLTYAVQ